MEDDVLVHEQEVTLHLLVELIGKFCAADVGWPWPCPLTADWAAVYHVR